MKISNFQSILVVLFASVLYTPVVSASIENEIPGYSTNEIRALKEFRPMVKDTLYRSYMKEDGYLITWLRAKKLDLTQASHMIRRAHKWRIENEIDTIQDRPYELTKVLPFRNEGFDREGRPVLEQEVGKWDIRRFVMAGQTDRYTMHVNRIFELGCIRARASGKTNVTELVMISNLAGYSVRQHGCLACIPAHIQTVTEYEAYYPEVMKNVYLVNTPRIFHALYQLMQPFMSDASRKAMKMYGLDADEWQAQLHKHIAPDQLSVNFGGTRV